MIPAIIYYLLRRYKRVNPVKAEKLSVLIRKTGKVIFVCLLLLLMGYFAWPQDTQLQYVIKRKGSEIGTISFSQQNSGNKKVLKMKSNIRLRVLFLFTATGQEESVFENGVLTSSFIYQKLNGNERVNKKTQLLGNNYVITKGKETETVGSYPISYNMVCLYDREPISISKVYSDAFQRLLDIQTIGDHHYKISFPDGNYNEYYYSNGACTKVEVHHRLYRSTFELKTN